MLGWCIMTLAGARLKASVRFLSLREMYHKEALTKDATLLTTLKRVIPTPFQSSIQIGFKITTLRAYFFAVHSI